MHRKRGDWPNSVVYTLAIVLGLSLGVEAFLLVTDEPVQVVQVTGRATGTVMLGILGVCSGPLQEGWNLISLCSNTTSPNITFVLSGIDFRYVMRWNESGAFEIFSPLAASNPFTQFEINRSYFVYLNSVSDEISPNSNLNPSMNITLTQGWSTPSWPYEFSVNFTQYFNGSVHRYHMKWNATTQEFVIWSPRAAAPPPSIMYVGDGQFIYSDVQNVLSYNKTNLSG